MESVLRLVYPRVKLPWRTLCTYLLRVSIYTSHAKCVIFICRHIIVHNVIYKKLVREVTLCS